MKSAMGNNVSLQSCAAAAAESVALNVDYFRVVDFVGAQAGGYRQDQPREIAAVEVVEFGETERAREFGFWIRLEHSQHVAFVREKPASLDVGHAEERIVRHWPRGVRVEAVDVYLHGHVFVKLWTDA